MAQQRRMIYAQLAENKEFASLTDKAQKTYIFLIVLADDDGRVKGDSDWLRIKIFPYDQKITTDHVKSYIKEITKVGLITWYKADDGNYYISHPNWTKYQILRQDRKKNSNIPPPNDNQMTTKRVHKISKLSKEGKELNNSTQYLKKIPDDDLEEFYNRFDCSKKAIQSKAEDLLSWCETNGRVKKNYKTFLLVALKKDFEERKEPLKKTIKTISENVENSNDKQKTPEEEAKIKKQLDKIKKDLTKLGVLKQIQPDD
jgi:hypothetical protein